MRARGVLLATTLALGGCGGDDAGSGGDSGTDSGTGATGDATGSGGSSDGDAGGTDDGTDTGPLLDGEVTVVHYETQPMVVDLLVTLTRPGTVTATVAGDPGARVSVISGDAPALEHRVRLRGLMPDAAHDVAVDATEDGGATDSTSVSFDTLPPLAGFEGQFDVAGPGTTSTSTRLFDQFRLDVQSLFVIDPDGRTRWHVPMMSAQPGPYAVITGAQILDDGAVRYIQDHALVTVDELGVEVDVTTAEDLGLPGLHHDVIMLPNGNMMVLSFAFQDVYYADDDATYDVGGDLIAELSPDGEVVWTWSTFDHLDPQRRRDGFDGPFPITNPDTGMNAKDWTHGNGIVYEPDTDTILFCMRNQDWIIRIDHQSGDVVWRLGDGGDFALMGGTWFFHQHSPQWQPDGSLLLYDNGNGNPGLPPAQERSRPVRYALDEVAMTATQVWEETNERFISAGGGDADLLDNGNILVTDSSAADGQGPMAMGAGRIREVDPVTNEWRWWIEFDDGVFVYRTIPYGRIPGEAGP